MEKYSSNIRLILVCNSISNIIAPIKSRTLLVRIPSPSVDDINHILGHVAEKESLKFSTHNDSEINHFYSKVAETSNRNLRRCLLSFETISMQNETINVRSDVAKIALDWEAIIRNMAISIQKNQNVATLAKTRVVLYELLSHCIPARIILKTLLFDLIDIFSNNNELVLELINQASIFDERLSLGLKSIFHLEGFVAKSMVSISNLK